MNMRYLLQLSFAEAGERKEKGEEKAEGEGREQTGMRVDYN